MAASSIASLNIVIFGASGDLARRKTFPALYSLFRLEQLPANLRIIGYSRTEMTKQAFHQKLEPFLKKGSDDPQDLTRFLEHVDYMPGQYDQESDYLQLKARLLSSPDALNIFYMALPPSVFLTVAQMVRRVLYNPEGANRVVIEKPFGRDSQSSAELSEGLAPLFSEAEVYRIDHYLGKEMVKNLLVLRFANRFMESIWSGEGIDTVQIVFKETLGVEGRGGYYDEFGVIRDVLQNHILQMLSIIAMEPPKSLSADDIRDAKVAVLKCIRPLELSDVILGQYTRSEDGAVPGYAEDETVPSNSITPTFAFAVGWIDNDRWRGVPFIMRTGKGLDSQKAEVRIQFKDAQSGLFNDASSDSPLPRNELVMRVHPNEAIYMKMISKRPGLSLDTALTDLDLNYRDNFEGLRIPDAYEALLLDVLNGEQQNFVRKDELEEAWKIVTPVLHRIEREHIVPIGYPFCTRGPPEADQRLGDLGYRRSMHDYWPWSVASREDKLN